MKMTVNNRFGILLAEKRIKERRSISLAEVAEATKISRQALYKWQNNSIDRFEVRVIDALCEYFDIQPGDLFHYVKPEKGKSGKINVLGALYHPKAKEGPLFFVDADSDPENVTAMLENRSPKKIDKVKPKSRKKKKPAA